MSHPVTATPSNEVLSVWAAKGLGKAHLEQIQKAQVLIVPEENYRQGVPYVFHHGTGDFFRYLQARIPQGTLVELCADDEEYLELTLHSATFRFSKIVATVVAVPLVVNLLSSYIYDELKAKPTDQVEASIVVQDHKCEAFKFEFHGEAKDFHLLADQVGEFVKKCEPATTTEHHHQHKS